MCSSKIGPKLAKDHSMAVKGYQVINQNYFQNRKSNPSINYHLLNIKIEFAKHKDHNFSPYLRVLCIFIVIGANF